MKPTIHFGGSVEAPEVFHARCARSAAALQELGIAPGDVVALMLHNEPVLLELVVAASTVGAHYCLVNWHFTAAEVRHILTDSGAKALIAHANLVEQIRAGIPANVRVLVARVTDAARTAFGIDEAAAAPAHGLAGWDAWRDDVTRPAVPPALRGSMMIYTSGTTGVPKGIRRLPPSPVQLERIAQVSRIALGVEPGMRALISAPLYHSAPGRYIVESARQDAHLWIQPRFDAEETLRVIESERITHAYLVPTMYRRLLRLLPEVRNRYDLRSVRFVASTGSPCPAHTKRDMIDWWGPVFHESYAASELGWVTHIDSTEALRKPGSAGRAIPGITVKVLSEVGEELPAETVGLICVGHDIWPDFTYVGNDEARRRLELGGLLTVRDVGFLDREGYLYVVDRDVDMVISGGVNIYPAEIEAALATMPGVVDCAVFGVPDEEFGESLVAAVQLAPGAAADAAQVQSFLRERIAGYKVPRSVVFHAQLPREDTGKIFKRKLRDPYWQGMGRRV